MFGKQKKNSESVTKPPLTGEDVYRSGKALETTNHNAEEVSDLFKQLGSLRREILLLRQTEG